MSRELDMEAALLKGYHAFEETFAGYTVHVFYETAEPWRRDLAWKDTSSKDRYRELSLDEVSLEYLYSESLPPFSTDIASAWKLVGWAETRGVLVDIENRAPDGYEVSTFEYIAHTGRRLLLASISVSSLDEIPEAICKALIETHRIGHLQYMVGK